MGRVGAATNINDLRDVENSGCIKLDIEFLDVSPIKSAHGTMSFGASRNTWTVAHMTVVPDDAPKSR